VEGLTGSFMNVKTFVCKTDFSCNVYVCESEKGNFIVDLGYYDLEISDYLKKLSKIDFVIETHCHFDHIMGLNDFKKEYPDVPVYCFTDEQNLAHNPRQNGSVLMGNSFVPEFEFIQLKEGKIKIGGFDVKVIHTPGHTGGSCVYYFEKEKILFTGDTIIESSIGRTDLPTGDEAQIYSSVKKISALGLNEEVKCYFGHGMMLKYGELIKVNPFLSL